MATITKEQVRRIYALGAAVGILESGNKDDHLHVLVGSLTGKESVRELTSAEFRKVEAELLSRMKYKNRQQPLKPKEVKDIAGTTAPGMMNKAQQGLAWHLIYQLQELDAEKSKATVGERLVGAIKKICNVDAKVEHPFMWLTLAQGQHLITNLKWYVQAAEERAAKRGSG